MPATNDGAFLVTALLVFLFTYVALSVGRVPGLQSDRLAACIVGAVVLVASGVLPLPEAQASVDGGTLGLLFGMMILSAALEISGTFALAGWWITRRARTPLHLLLAVCLAAAILSAFLINDVVCIAFTPLLLHICDSLERDPKPYLLALATSSNIGSVATITGNPQNILIGSLSHISYGRFAAVLAPVAALALAGNVAVIWIVHRRSLEMPFAKSAPDGKPDVHLRWVRKSSAVMLAVLVAFVSGVPPAVAALIGASLMLLTRAVDPKRLYARVDWPLLALFAGLFIVVARVERAGLADALLRSLEPAHPESVIGLTAVTAILSNVVSNVPAVMVLKTVVPRFAHTESSWLVLAMASTLAGNLTLPGSLATIIVVERARHRSTISFLDFLKVGVPSALLGLVAGALWLGLWR